LTVLDYLVPRLPFRETAPSSVRSTESFVGESLTLNSSFINFLYSSSIILVAYLSFNNLCCLFNFKMSCPELPFSNCMRPYVVGYSRDNKDFVSVKVEDIGIAV